MDDDKKWFKKVSSKSKLHFDKKKSYSKACFLVDRENVAKHKFFPFINFTMRAFKYSKLKQFKRQGITPIPRDELYKKREINYACYADSYIFAYYNAKLTEIYEELLATNNIFSPIAYRSIKKRNNVGKNNIDFAAEAFYEIKKRKNCFCIGLDIEGFFDNLDHNILKSTLIKVLKCDENKLPDDWYLMYKVLTNFHFIKLDTILKCLNKKKSDFWEDGKGFNTLCSPIVLRNLIQNHPNLVEKNKNIEKRKGIPQGTNISGLLANIYMFDFDIELENFLKPLGGYYRRYSDDILIIVENELLAENVIFRVMNMLRKLELNLSVNKTCASKFENGKGIACKVSLIDKVSKENSLQYLGFTYDGKNIRVRNSTLGNFWKDSKPHIKRMIISSLENHRNIPKGKIYGLYSHMRNRKGNSDYNGNFYDYIRKADDKFKKEYDFAKETKIKKQLKNAWEQLNNYMNEIETDYLIANPN